MAHDIFHYKNDTNQNHHKKAAFFRITYFSELMTRIIPDK